MTKMIRVRQKGGKRAGAGRPKMPVKQVRTAFWCRLPNIMIDAINEHGASKTDIVEYALVKTYGKNLRNLEKKYVDLKAQQ